MGGFHNKIQLHSLSTFPLQHGQHLAPDYIMPDGLLLVPSFYIASPTEVLHQHQMLQDHPKPIGRIWTEDTKLQWWKIQECHHLYKIVPWAHHNDADQGWSQSMGPGPKQPRERSDSYKEITTQQQYSPRPALTNFYLTKGFHNVWPTLKM